MITQAAAELWQRVLPRDGATAQGPGSSSQRLGSRLVHTDEKAAKIGYSADMPRK